MKTVFIGVVKTGRLCLEALLEQKADIAGIFTADKQKMAAYSGMHPDYFSDFEDLAEKYALPLFKADTVQTPLDMTAMEKLAPDIIFCIGWPQLVRKDILQIPRCGSIGIHPTLLPKRRGGAPINWTIIDGLEKSGVSLFYFDEGVDSGDIIAQKGFEITLQDDCRSVLEKVNRAAAELVRVNYPLLAKGKAPRIPQNNAIATYTRRRRPEQGAIDWQKTSLAVYNWTRALSLPFPGAFTYWQGKKVIVWETELLEGYRARVSAAAGEVLESLPGRGMVAATGDNGILIKTVEVDGEKMGGDIFMKNHALDPGSILGELK